MRVLAQLFLPTVEISLCFFQTLEAFTFERSFLGMADSCFHFAFAIGILNATGQCHRAVESKHISKQWIDGRIVDVGLEHTFTQIVEDDDPLVPPRRRKAFSCSSAQVCELERNTSRRTDLRL